MLRGEVYYADLSGNINCEQSGCRPVVIVQNDIGNKFSPTTIVAPLTLANKKDLPTHVRTDLFGIAMCEQVRCIDKSRIQENCIGTFTDVEMQELNTALAIAIGL